MPAFEDSAKALVTTAGKIARLQNADAEASILEESTPSLVQTGSEDNWSGTTNLFTLMLEVPIGTYASIEVERNDLEEWIRQRLAPLIRRHVGNAITQVIISLILAEEFRPPISSSADVGTQEEVPSFWQPGFFRLFISHTSANKESAHRLGQALAEYHVAAFVAHDHIEPTKEWQAEIERALRTMDAMAAIITPDFYESRWCDQEVGFALGRAKLVVPLRKEADPHGFLGKYQGFKIKGLLPAQVAEQLLGILAGHTLSAERIAEALVEQMVSSKNWDTSKRTMTLLEKTTRLNNSQIARLMQSIEENSKVGSAFGVPERIRGLIVRISKSPAT